ncbi:MAG: hypothetical protein Q8K36_06200, partial [Alphaproteobacteria bacterium]|nr:hypothetical protein [Alphaproteobacteria bacterium]
MNEKVQRMMKLIFYMVRTILLLMLMEIKSFWNAIQAVSGFGSKKRWALKSVKLWQWLYFLSIFLCSCSTHSKYHILYSDLLALKAQITKNMSQTDVCMMINHMVAIDQKARNQLAEITPGDIKLIKDIDQLNSECVKSILDVYDIDALAATDPACNQNIWLLIQHSPDLDFQKWFLRKIPCHTPMYAYLYDRIQIRMGLKQKYGTQFDYDEKT